MIKRIGSEARIELEAMLGTKIYLELFVRLEKDWTKKGARLKEFGYK